MGGRVAKLLPIAAIAIGAPELLAAAGVGEGAATAASLAGEGFGAGTIADLTAGTFAAGAAGTAAGVGLAGGTSFLSNLKTVSSVLSPISSIVSAGANISATKKMADISAAPQVAPPITMPSPSGIQSLKATQANFTSQLQRRGRASTILTSPDGERLGS